MANVHKETTGSLTCNICNHHVLIGAGLAKCPSCGSQSRTRTLPQALVRHVGPRQENGPIRELLAFATSQAEKRALDQFFPEIKSVSPVGNQGDGHTSIIDIRNMPSIEDCSYSAITGIAILDFFSEIDEAARECFRVLRPNGMVFILISPSQLIDGNSPPRQTRDATSGEGVVNESNAPVQAYVFGRQWVVRKFCEAGFDASLEQISDPVTGEVFDWLISYKPFESAKLPGNGRKGKDCTICGHDLATLPPSEPNCPYCGARPRTRAFVPFTEQEIKPLVEKTGRSNLPLLAFAMTVMERKILAPYFDSFKSVSLFGHYGKDHEVGVDARDLSRYPDGAFSGSFGILVFDYFEEHEQALAEAARVIVDGGIFFHQISTARLVKGNVAPVTATIIKKRPGYFDYVPDDAAMASIKVGIDWFTGAMETSGFETRHVNIPDEHTGEANHWFLGIRRPRGQYSLGILRQTPFRGFEKTQPFVLRRASNFPAVSKYDCAGEEVYRCTPKMFSAPVLRIVDTDRIVFEASIPPLPSSLRSCQFAEHVFDGAAGESTDDVIVVGDGKVGVSGDLGQTWKRIEPRGFETTRFYRCFTTQSGRHIVQAIGWLGRNDTEQPEVRHGQLFLFSPAWDLIDVIKTGDAHWHGSASVAEKNGTIMYADYHDNGAKYQSGFAVSRSLQSKIRSCGIWRSKDDGLTWEKVFEQDPSRIRHFHTLIADPFDADVWWASSGDLANECRVWRSPDNGNTWIDCSDPDPDISVPLAFAGRKAAAHRHTDAAVLKDYLIWGSDDLIGSESDYNAALPLNRRAGSRVYRSRKTLPLRLEELAYIGQPVRSMIDVGRGWILTTEGKARSSGFRASIFFLSKSGGELLKVCDADNFRKRGTGLTYSISSRKAKQGHFFSFKGFYDFLDNSPRIAQYKITYVTD